jgi:signal-transduction protein with cAMP-binding, CBS, and nucleotidyltransferase domain
MDQLITLRTLPVSALMNKEFQIIKGSATVAEALQMMKKSGDSGIIVEPRNEDDCYGIVTEKDILEKVIDPGEDIHRDPWNTPVFQIMSKPVISVNPNMRIKYALRLMKRTNIRRLTVMDSNRIIGMLSMSDVLHAVEELPVHDDHIAL